MGTYTTEQTGKSWKLLQALAVLLLIGSAMFGVYAWQEDRELMLVAVLGWFVGICGIIAAKAGAWLFHG